MEKIQEIWFEGERIFMRSDEGKTYSRPLEAFPLLKEADEVDRLAFKIGRFGDDVRWETIDEDVHISGFYDTTEAEPVNPVSEIFKRFPQLNVSEVARSMGINKSLLSKYIYGIKKPGAERVKQIREALHALGEGLLSI